MDNNVLKGWGLLSFPPSTGCELARWAMQLYGLEFSEEWHTVPFLQQRSQQVGTTDKSFPIIYKGDNVYSSSITGLGYLESIVPSDRKLVPANLSQAQSVLQLWTASFYTLGQYAGPWAYSYLLPVRDIMVPVFGHNCPANEKEFVETSYPTVANLVGGALKIGPDTAKEAMVAIERMFSLIDGLLQDGREFLIGNRLTIADMSFACLGVPLVWAPGFDGALPPLEKTPNEIQTTVAKFRNRLSGKFILRMFEVYRPSLIRDKVNS
ncbi:MAG: glutathione binding-like protein [Synechococcus sp.]